MSKVSASKTRVFFWGVRGSIPTPGPGTVRYGGNTSCVEVRAEGEIIVLQVGHERRPIDNPGSTIDQPGQLCQSIQLIVVRCLLKLPSNERPLMPQL